MRPYSPERRGGKRLWDMATLRHRLLALPAPTTIGADTCESNNRSGTRSHRKDAFMTSILRNTLLVQTLIWICLTPYGAGGVADLGASHSPTGGFASGAWQTPARALHQNPPLLEPETT